MIPMLSFCLYHKTVRYNMEKEKCLTFFHYPEIHIYHYIISEVFATPKTNPKVYIWICTYKAKENASKYNYYIGVYCSY